MKVFLTDGNKKVFFTFPTSVLCSRAAVRFIEKRIFDNEYKFPKETLRAMVRELNRFRKKHKGWVLVDVESGAQRVIIKL